MEYEPQRRSRAWSLTNFAVEQFSLQDLCTLSTERGAAAFIGQREVCPRTDRLHYQCALRYHDAKSWAAIRAAYPSCHVEPGRSWNALKKYCSKTESRVNVDETPVTHGCTIPATKESTAAAKTAKIIALGPDAALTHGYINLMQYGQVVRNL